MGFMVLIENYKPGLARGVGAVGPLSPTAPKETPTRSPRQNWIQELTDAGG
jgi:hypothetical protein